MGVFRQRVYLTGDGTHYVPEGDPDAAFLAFPVGAQLSDALIAQRGLEAFTVAGNPAVRGFPVHNGPMLIPNPAGTNPPGHATASVPGVPAEVAPVVTVAPVTTPAPATTAAARDQSNRAAGKPARSREV